MLLQVGFCQTPRRTDLDGRDNPRIKSWVKSGDCHDGGERCLSWPSPDLSPRIVAAIHAFLLGKKTWVAGPSPAMTKRKITISDVWY